MSSEGSHERQEEPHQFTWLSPRGKASGVAEGAMMLLLLLLATAQPVSTRSWQRKSHVSFLAINQGNQNVLPLEESPNIINFSSFQVEISAY